MLLMNINQPLTMKMPANQLQNIKETIMKSNPRNLTKTQQSLKKVNPTSSTQKTNSTERNISLRILNRRTTISRRRMHMKRSRFDSMRTWVFCRLTLPRHNLDPSQPSPDITRNQPPWPEEETGLLQVWTHIEFPKVLQAERGKDKSQPCFSCSMVLPVSKLNIDNTRSGYFAYSLNLWLTKMSISGMIFSFSEIDWLDQKSGELTVETTMLWNLCTWQEVMWCYPIRGAVGFLRTLCLRLYLSILPINCLELYVFSILPRNWRESDIFLIFGINCRESYIFSILGKVSKTFLRNPSLNFFR